MTPSSVCTGVVLSVSLMLASCSSSPSLPRSSSSAAETQELVDLCMATGLERGDCLSGVDFLTRANCSFDEKKEFLLASREGVSGATGTIPDPPSARLADAMKVCNLTRTR